MSIYIFGHMWLVVWDFGNHQLKASPDSVKRLRKKKKKHTYLKSVFTRGILWLRGELWTDLWQKGSWGSLAARCYGRRAACSGWAMGCPAHSSRQLGWSRAHWQHMIKLQITPQDRCITHPWLNGRQQAQKRTSQGHSSMFSLTAQR